MDNKYKITAIIAAAGILVVVIIFMIMKPRRRTDASGTVIYSVTRGVQINRDDITTNNKFDLDKFNRKYDEIKAKKKEAYRKREAERLAKMQELNTTRQGVKVLDMKVYDVLVDYSRNMQGIVIDITNGVPWIHNNRLMYLGWTFMIVSMVYFVINNI